MKTSTAAQHTKDKRLVNKVKSRDEVRRPRRRLCNISTSSTSTPRPMPISRTRLGTVLVMVLSVAGCYYGSTTETPNPSLGSDTIPDTTNPPDRVGRIAYIDGAVSFRPAEADTWAFAELNRTVTTGDRLWVDTVGHAEIEVGPNAVRVGPETEVDAVHIDEDMVQVRVP